MRKARLFLVDDHQLFRNGLKFIINERKDMEVAGEASNGKEFLELLDFVNPDVVLMDIGMPVMDGIEATRSALQRYPDLKILVLSMFGESEYYNAMIDMGVKGFVLKDSDNEELYQAILKVFAGGTHFSQELLLSIIRNKTPDNNVLLTRREKDVLNLICQGLSNQQISEKLIISQRTVERHRANLLAKTDSKNSISLVIYAIRNRLVKI
ncbi:MAG: response regulator transcription factor [Bacteroidales bacterium]|nr:response regulator transcription factor [Bacteroidales bacterium]MBN2762143.1 response regulator transcription factor [Bacteroidales bacterium]